jgi:hypothetical protein
LEQFGVGKSSFVRKLASDKANRIKSGDKDTDYVPILVPDTNMMDNYYHGRSVEDTIENIVTPHYDSKKILIIFDGVDEYKYGVKAFLNRIRGEFFKRYDRRKIILTTRLNPEFPEEYEATNEDTYLRLLPFTIKQTDKFFEYLETELTYQKALELGVTDEDIRKPLLAFVLCTVYRDNQQDLLILKEEEALTSSEYRAFIYQNFLHRLIKGKMHESKVSKGKFNAGKYREEKRILRRIALLIKLFRENLTSNIILNKNSAFIEFFELEMDNEPLNRLQDILHDYFSIEVEDNSADSRVLFIHSTFKEYLMAENYIEILLLNPYWMINNEHDTLNPYWMNISIPNGAKMMGSQLNYATIYHASFKGADLSKADLSYSNTPRCIFTDAIMNGVKTRGTNMEETNLSSQQSEKLYESKSAVRI